MIVEFKGKVGSFGRCAECGGARRSRNAHKPECSHYGVTKTPLVKLLMAHDKLSARLADFSAKDIRAARQHMKDGPALKLITAWLAKH